jgi:hypothetical protein
MRGPWWYPVWNIAQHTLVYAASFAFLALSAAYGSAITTLVSHVIASKFVIHVLIFLEYAAVAADALIVLGYLIQHLRRGFKGMIQ